MTRIDETPVDAPGRRVDGGAAGAFLTYPAGAFGLPVCRLGLASRGGSSLSADDVLHAIDRGINFLNWPGVADTPGGPDGLSAAVASLGNRRESVVVSAQFGARTAADAAIELRDVLDGLRSDYVDLLTLYYVEHREEWRALTGPGGALAYLRGAKQGGVVRALGVTSHQRSLAAEMARSGWLDVLMIRYNAAHRGAEREVFPVTDALRMPVIAYTALRWGALLAATPDDPPGFRIPEAPDWYRFVLQSPSVAVVLAAPDNRAELNENLTILDATGPLSAEEYDRLADHGERVRRYAPRFI
jgi:aryl-alcohol dehydrogenase-like predicted oxidoreductase